MINYVILILLAAAMILSIITVAAEPIFKRNSGIGCFFREIRIRLREISLTSFCVTSVLLLLWGVIVHDMIFEGIWTAIVMLFTIMFVLHTEDILDLTKRRKKAKLKKLLPLAKPAALCEKEAKEAEILPELTPTNPSEYENSGEETMSA
ncbi:MAG: hypothetical protein NC485_02240 [Ruminococcus flavefaciens]|nr:hypothetical protein [Ruminococcus flavefaciens]MCM1059986.1 hypothetical protein [Eubacterium sp.]